MADVLYAVGAVGIVGWILYILISTDQDGGMGNE